MKNHYLPRFYLKGFSADGERTWLLDLLQERQILTPIKKAGHETDLYPAELETSLANLIEQPAQTGLERLRNRLELAEVDRVHLARYFLYLWRRVPNSRERILDMVPGFLSRLEGELGALVHELSVNETDPEQFKAQKASEIAAIISDLSSRRDPDVWHGVLEFLPSEKIMQALLSMRWRVMTSENIDFVTSDNPVFFFPQLGIGRPDSYISVPISSNLHFIADRDTRSSPFFFEGTRQQIKTLNKRTVENARRFAFSKSEEIWPAAVFKKRGA